MEVFKNIRNLKCKSISLSENLTKDRYSLPQSHSKDWQGKGLDF